MMLNTCGECARKKDARMTRKKVVLIAEEAQRGQGGLHVRAPKGTQVRPIS